MLRVVLYAILLLASQSAFATLTHWKNVNPLDLGNHFEAVRWDGGQFIAVGQRGLIATSSDGINWTARDSGTDYDLYAVTYSAAHNKHIAVGIIGTILISADNGITWTSKNSGTTKNLFSIACNNPSAIIGSGVERCVIGGSSLTLISDDSLLWTAGGNPHVTYPNPEPDSDILGFSGQGGASILVKSLLWDGNRFIAAGGSSGLLTSTDGISWTQQIEGKKGLILNSIAWDEASTYIATGDRGSIVISTNGIDWLASTMTGVTASILDTIWTGSQFAAVGTQGTILSSTDGTPANWTVYAHNTPGTAPLLESIAYNGSNQFTVAGNETLIYNNSLGTAMDDPSWLTPSSPLQNLHSITWDGSRYLVTGDNGTLLESNDGAGWSPVPTFPVIGNIIFDTAYNGTEYISVGDTGLILSSPTNMATWTDENPIQALTSATINTVEANGSTFIATDAAGKILQRDAAGIWTNPYTDPMTRALNAIAIGADGTIVTVGVSGSIQTKPAAGAWINSSKGTASFNDITASPTLFVAVGEYGVILTSSDGVRQEDGGSGWQSQITPTQHHLKGITWTGNQFIVVGDSTYPAPALTPPLRGKMPIILSSPDGLIWTKQPSGTAYAQQEYFHHLNDISHDNAGQLTAVGEAGLILLGGRPEPAIINFNQSPEKPAEFDLVNYTYTLRNNNVSSIDGATLQITIPPEGDAFFEGITLLPAASTPCSNTMTVLSTVINCPLDTLQPDINITATLVLATTANNTPFTVSAEIISPKDANASNNHHQRSNNIIANVNILEFEQNPPSIPGGATGLWTLLSLMLMTLGRILLRRPI